MKLRIILSIFALIAMQTVAVAQSNPNLTFGQVLTPAQWSNLFAQKQDVLGFTPLNIIGGVMSGRLVTASPSSTTAGLNLTPGTTPGSPVNGDLWVTSSGIFAQVNGATINLTGAASTSFAGTSPITVSFPSGVVTYACATCGVTGSPLSQFAATTSAQLAGVLSDETGTGLAVFNNAPAITSPVITGPLALPSGTTATGMVLTTPALGVATGSTLALNGAAIGSNSLAVNGTFAFSLGGSFGGALTGITTLASGAHTITSASASALSVGLNGATNPAFNVNASTASQASGVGITGDVTAGTPGIVAIDSGANTNLTINSKGVGTLTLNNIATGSITLARAAAFSAGITAASLATPSSNIAGSLCQTSAGVFLYAVGVNCFTSGAATSLAPGTTTISPSVSGSILYDNAGTLGEKTIANFLAAGSGISITGTTTATISQSLTNAILQTNLTSPAGTTSTTGVMAGFGSVCKLTPVYSTRLLVFISGNMYSSLATASNFTRVQFGTGTAPANGVAVTGTAVGNGTSGISTGASQTLPFTVGGLVTGLTPSTAYWFDLDMESSTASSGANYANMSCMIVEF